MVEEAARNLHTILIVAIWHLLVSVLHQVDQRRGLKSICVAHRRQEATVVTHRSFNRAAGLQERALREDSAHEALLPSHCCHKIHPQHLLLIIQGSR